MTALADQVASSDKQALDRNEQLQSGSSVLKEKLLAPKQQFVKRVRPFSMDRQNSR